MTASNMLFRLLTIVYLYLNTQLINCVIVETPKGKIEGYTDTDNINKFYGIPFAQPPINELRFAAPQEMEPWNDIFAATISPFLVPACMQTCTASPTTGLCPFVVSEDCLYLNVFTPLNAEYMTTNYPVMIWIHGGSFFEGWGSFFLYDPSNIVHYINDTIIITINYRLGLFGFFYDNMYDTNINGNYGYLDQQLAIKWVYENIKYFGGDQNNIILFGESAGAMSISLHLLYNNDQYFKGAIMQSNPIGFEYRTPKKWYDVPQKFSKIIGCNHVINIIDSSDSSDLLDIINCWRSVDAETILTAQSNNLLIKNWNVLPFTPTVETDLLSQQPIFAFQSGQYDTVPFIIGYNSGEHYLFTSLDMTYFNQTNFGYNDLKNTITNGHSPYFFESGNEVITEMILLFHNITNESTGNSNTYVNAAADIYTYWSFICPTINVLKNIKNKNNIYLYEFDIIDAVLNQFFLAPSFPECWTHSCHVTELFYVFLQPLFYDTMQQLNPQSIETGQQLQTFWTNYAKSLNPNKPIQSNDIWPNIGDNNHINFIQFTGDGYNHDWIKTYSYIKDNTNNLQNICNFYDSIGYAGVYPPSDSSDSSEDTLFMANNVYTHNNNHTFNGDQVNIKIKLSTSVWLNGSVILGICFVTNIILCYCWRTKNTIPSVISIQ